MEVVLNMPPKSHMTQEKGWNSPAQGSQGAGGFEGVVGIFSLETERRRRQVVGWTTIKRRRVLQQKNHFD
jgi:hypothetical protein